MRSRTALVGCVTGLAVATGRNHPGMVAGLTKTLLTPVGRSEPLWFAQVLLARIGWDFRH